MVGSAPETPAHQQYFEHPPRSHLYRDPSKPSAPFESAEPVDGKVPKKKLSALLLTGLMYTFAIGGGYGIEESVMGGGPLLAILSIIIIPILMSLPISLIVAEMASAVPSNAGFLMWVNLSFHRSIYLATAILSFLLIFVDNALYPVIFSEYMCTAFTCTDTTNKLLRLGMVLFTFVLNIMGVEAVGTAGVVMTTITVSPFLLMFTLQLFKNKFYLNWPNISYVPSKIDWVTFVTTASWNLSGLEQAGAVVEDIKDPQRTILRALIPLVGLCFVTYLPPVLAGASAQKGPMNLDDWTTGFWAEVSNMIGGPVLKYYTIIGSVISAFGTTLSAICTTTCIIAGMALTEVVPGKLGIYLCHRNKRFGSYHWGLILNTTLTALFSTLLDFGPLIKIDQFLYGIRVCLIFGAFFRFRHMYPHLERPYRIPFSGWKLYAVLGIPFLSFVGLTILAMVPDRMTCFLSLGVLAGSLFISWVFCFFYRTEDYLGRIVTVVEGESHED